MAKELTPLSQEDYESIEAAVMETERGRWFLSEYAKRNRNADTTVLLDAIQKLGRSVAAAKATGAEPEGLPNQVQMNLVEMISAIAETRRQIASMRPEDGDESSFAIATDELEAIVTATEAATQNILEAAEHIQESAWTMREAGVDESHCEKLDELVTEIYTSCSFQDITGQRISKVVSLLSYLEERLEAMRQIWAGEEAPSHIVATQDALNRDNRPDAHLLNGPQLDADAQSQNDIDLIMVDIEEDQVFVPDPPKPAEVEAEKAPAAAKPSDNGADDIDFDDDDLVDDIFAEETPAEVGAANDDDDELFAETGDEMVFQESDIIGEVASGPENGEATADEDDIEDDIFEDGPVQAMACEPCAPDDLFADEAVAQEAPDMLFDEAATIIEEPADDEAEPLDVTGLDDDEKLALFS